MKELTIEEKARRYDEAIEKGKQIQNTPYTAHWDIMKEVAEHLLPELRESEDERMRNAAINACKYMVDNFENSTKQYEDAIAWLEKQGEQKPNPCDGCTNRKGCINCENGELRETEQKSIDKVEPKFHEGEWITNGDYTWQIVSVTDLDYILQSQDGNTVDDTISHVDEQFHSFTIEDAKDGDVLRIRNLTFIFQEITNNNVCHKDAAVAYCSYEDYNDGFGVCGPDCITDLEIITPATKEQRDLLFQKMKEAGYKWDAEKKELKKIEHETALCEEDELSCFESALFTAFSYAWQSYLLGEEVNVKQWAKEHSKELLKAAKEELKGNNTAWSEEDERMYKGLHNLIYSAQYCDSRKELSDWLKSLKDRYTWKPSDEQLNALDEVYKTHGANNVSRRIIFNLLEQLKKL